MKQKIKNRLIKVKNRLTLSKSEIPVKTIAVCAAQVPFFTGGAETHVEGLIKNLKEFGFEVDLINIPYKWYPHDQLLKSIEIWQALDLSESNGKKIDMVIATKFPSYFVQHSNKVLWLIHQYRQMYDLFNTPYSGFNPKSSKDMQFRDELIQMDTRALKSFPNIFTNSKNTGKRLQEFNNIPSIPLYHPPKLVGQYFTADYQDYMLCVGRLDKLKRVDLLLHTLSHCQGQVRCKIAGTGPEMESLRALARELGIEERVEFLGFVSDQELLQLYANCRVVFFAPLDEDYGYITLEAFLSKKPVITAFDSGGPLEFVIHQKNGIILDSLDYEQTAQAMEGLYFDQAKCQEYGHSGYEVVKSISWDHVIKSLVFGDTE